MKKLLLVLLAALLTVGVATAQEDDYDAFTRTHPLWFQGGIIPADLTVVSKNVLSSELLNETAFTTHAKWDATGDFVDTGGNCLYTHSTGVGTCTQTAANQLVRGAPSTAADPRWANFVYQITSQTGAAPTCTVTTAYALTAQSLPISVSSFSRTFRSALAPGAFTISCVSTTTGTAAFDNVSLKRAIGGAIIGHGVHRGEDFQVGVPFTPGTMAYETSSLLRTRVDSFTWTNAQVVALGAGLTGDITVATIPAKTAVLDAKVVITGQAAGTTTLTVACGIVAAGYIDWVVASDAKAAVNTVYGDAAAERGTSLDIEFYALPSYAAESIVKCHFISTGTNLDTVTASSGRVILVTTLLP